MTKLSKDILKANHIMLDLETTGQAPTSEILEIGAISFRLDEGKLDANKIENFARVFHARIFSDKITFDRSTLQWWLDDSARQAIILELLEDGDEILPIALSRFNAFLREEQNKDAYLWAWPTHFDIPILLNAYYESGAPLPTILKYPNVRKIMDVRTILNLLPEGWISEAKNKRKEDAHSAIRDCCVQIESLQAMIADVLL